MKLPSTGHMISGKYRLDEIIGEGGFAVVYRAVDTAIDRAVAVKILKPQGETIAVAEATRFAREARSVAALTDQHTVRMFDFGRTDDGLLFMVFELLAGRDLSDRLEDGPMDEATVIHVMRQVLLSLREAHSVGVLHRDIKPGNLRLYEYMDDRHRVKVMDFGIAWSMASEAVRITRTGHPVGTPRYMSPEQLMGAEMTPAADIYSLGLVAHEMLTNAERAPVDAIIAGRPIEVPASAAFARVLNKMLKHSARDRYQSADAVLAELDAIARPLARAGDTTLREEGAGAVKPGRQSLRPSQIAAVAGAVVLIGVMAVALVRRASAPAPPPPPTAAARLKQALQRPPGPAEEPKKPSAVVDAGAPPERQDGCGRVPERLGDIDVSHRRGLSSDSWVTYIPRGYDPDARHPLVLLFGAINATPRGILHDTKIQEFADRKQFVVIAPPPPDGYTWGYEVDTEPFELMIEQTRDSLCIDANRIFAIGHGTGGYPVESLSCQPWMTAIATTSFRPINMNANCSPARKIPRIMLAPVDSPFMPLEGGPNCANITVTPVAVFEKMWLARNECGREVKPTTSEDGSQCRRWDCVEEVVSCYAAGGFGWPDSLPRMLGACDGPPGKFPYLETIWDFFESVSPPHPK